MKHKNIIIIGIIVIFLISSPVFAGLEAVDELQQKAISIMLSEHPSLLSQQRIIDKMQGISLPERGFLYSQPGTFWSRAKRSWQWSGDWRQIYRDW